MPSFHVAYLQGKIDLSFDSSPLTNPLLVDPPIYSCIFLPREAFINIFFLFVNFLHMHLVV